ncbi:MAG: hypothetical protein ACOC53_05370 [Candidatus Saliniplasma sp.]
MSKIVKHLSILFIFLLCITLLVPAAAEAEAPGKGDTALYGYSSRENSGLMMALGSSVYLPQLHLELYSGERAYEWSIEIDGEVEESGDFHNSSWQIIDIELPERRIDLAIIVGPYSYHFSVVVTRNLEDTDEIDAGPEYIKIPKFEIQKLRWYHVAYGAINASVGVGISYLIIKYKKSEKWGDLTG